MAERGEEHGIMGSSNDTVDDVARATDSDTAPRRRGMSRRQLIRNAGIAGAAAWTAPMIIDSVSSAALATVGSCPGNKYYMKLIGRGDGADTQQIDYVAGDCYHASPSCNNTTDFNTGNNSPNTDDCTTNSGYEWVCTGGKNHGAKFRATFTDSNPGSPSTGTYTVVLATGCSFVNPPGTTYKAVANYNFNSDRECYAVAPSTSNSVIFNKSRTLADGNGGTLDYMYFEFTCT